MPVRRGEGWFDTSAGKASGGEARVVRIEGFDGQATEKSPR
jgi:hypothetical protein